MREREREQEKERERDREIIPSRLCTASAEPYVGLEPTNREIMTCADTKNWVLNLLSHSGTPNLFCLQ